MVCHLLNGYGTQLLDAFILRVKGESIEVNLQNSCRLLSYIEIKSNVLKTLL